MSIIGVDLLHFHSPNHPLPLPIHLSEYADPRPDYQQIEFINPKPWWWCVSTRINPQNIFSMSLPSSSLSSTIYFSSLFLPQKTSLDNFLFGVITISRSPSLPLTSSVCYYISCSPSQDSTRLPQLHNEYFHQWSLLLPENRREGQRMVSKTSHCRSLLCRM